LSPLVQSPALVQLEPSVPEPVPHSLFEQVSPFWQSAAVLQKEPSVPEPVPQKPPVQVSPCPLMQSPALLQGLPSPPEPFPQKPFEQVSPLWHWLELVQAEPDARSIVNVSLVARTVAPSDASTSRSYVSPFPSAAVVASE
jgi:hypothetical protein